MNILFVVGTNAVGAVEYYRATSPAEGLRRLGHHATVIGKDLAFKLGFENAAFFGQFDIVCFSRLVADEHTADWVRDVPWLLRSIGCAVITDYDDDLTNEHRQTYNGWLDLSALSAITVSTPYLKNKLKPYHKNIHVIPNAITPEMFGAHRFKRVADPDQIIIGLTGSRTHINDWNAVVDPIRDVLDQLPNTRVFCTGFTPEGLKDHPQLLTLKNFDPNWDESVGNGMISLEDYPGIMQQIDILLCPVDPADKFNWSKSNLKALEGQAAWRWLPDGRKGGCAVIATGDLPNYQDAVKDGSTGFLVNHADKNGWKNAILKVAISSETRTRVQAQGYEHCIKHFSLTARLAERVRTYSEILRGEKRARGEVIAKVAALASEE